MSDRLEVARQHRAQADANKALALKVLDLCPAWAWVITFYAALHYVSEYAAAQGRSFTRHSAREAWLEDSPLRHIGWAYDRLQCFSERARYHCPPANDCVHRAEYFRQFALPWLAQIEQAAHGAANKNGHP